MLLATANILIAVLGPLCMWLLGRTEPKVARWGWVVALASQPSWFYVSIVTEQPGLLAASSVFLLTQIQGFYNTWIKKQGN